MKFDRIYKIRVLRQNVNLRLPGLLRPLNSRFYMILAAGIFFVSLVPGQQLKFKQYTEENGLSSNQVNCLLEDDVGFLWFGTQDGLNKFDGIQFRIYRNDPSNAASIPNSCVRTVIQFSNNLFVIGSTDGISFFNPITERFYGTTERQFNLTSPVNAILRYDAKTILVANDLGLFALSLPDGKVIKSFFDDRAHIKVRTLGHIGNQIYVGTEGHGLWAVAGGMYLRPITFSNEEMSLQLRSVPQPMTIRKIGFYGGLIYLGTEQGIYKVSPRHEVLGILKTKEVKFDVVNDFVFWNNRLFAATEGGVAVHQLINQQYRLFSKSEKPMSLNNSACSGIIADSQNNFWIATNGGGINLSLFRSQKFPENISTAETDIKNVTCFLEPESDVFLIGGQDYLVEMKLKTGVKKNYQLPQGITPSCLLADSNQNVWLGTEGDGLYLLNRESGLFKNIVPAVMAKTINDLEFSSGQLLVATQESGLLEIQRPTLQIRQFKASDGLLSLQLNSIYCDSLGRLWLGTADNGIIRYSANRERKLRPEKIFRTNGKPGQIASNAVMSIAEDERGTIWVATAAGLSHLLPGDTFRNYYNKDGLSNTFLHALLRDSIGDLWASSNSGLIRFNPNDAEKEMRFRNYGIKDGLNTIEFNNGAALSRKNGMLAFGGADGFNVFRPSSIKDNPHKPKPIIVSFNRGGKEINTDSLIAYKRFLKLGAKENFLQFELAALDFTDPTKNKFQFMLEGYDMTWSEPSTLRFVSYTDLPGGSFVFKAKAANNDGIWNEEEWQLNILVVPPFWKTRVFYFLVIVALITVVYVYTHFRTQVVLRENRILEEKVAERTKELEEKNKDITSSIEYAKRIQEAILPSQDYIFNFLNEAFILYQPKDIVSGDFYWFAEQSGVHIFAVVDCTGHGVPGAFMSMIGHNLLHQIVSEKRIVSPGRILDHLHAGIQQALRQGENDVQTNDGMDVSIIALNKSNKKIEWAGANRPLLIVDPKGEMQRIEGDKFPVGGIQIQEKRCFKTHTVQADEGSMAYLFSDGYADQFGGEKGKKFMLRRFHSLLADIHLMTADEQQAALRHTFEDWKQNHEQVDDVLIAGIQL